MSQEDSYPTEPLEQEIPREDSSAFYVTDTVHFKPVQPQASRDITSLSPIITRLVSSVALSAALLGAMSGCGDSSVSLPCPVPTATPVGSSSSPQETPIACTSSQGTHYIWLPIRGGWVESDDGIHPNSNAHGVGADDGHGGNESSGGEHGGGEHGGFGGGGHGGGEGG